MTVRREEIDRCRPLADLPQAAKDALSAEARVVEFRRNERLIPMGEPPHRLLILTEGLVKLVGISANAHERILFLYRPGDIVGPTVLLDNFRNEYEATAMSAVQALSITRRHLLIIGRTHPQVILCLAREVSRLLSGMTRRMMSATSAEVPVRLSQLLIEFAGPHGRADDLVPLDYPLTHEEMAQIVGASRPHTSTVLRDLEELGAVQRRSARGLLVRPDRLERILDHGELRGLEFADRIDSPGVPTLGAA